MFERNHIVFKQPSSGLVVTLPRPDTIKKPIAIRSRVQHLPGGGTSTLANTTQYLQYTLKYKGALEAFFVEQYLRLFAAGNRFFQYYPNSLEDTFEEVFIVGQTKLDFLGARIPHASGMQFKFYSNL